MEYVCGVVAAGQLVIGAWWPDAQPGPDSFYLPEVAKR